MHQKVYLLYYLTSEDEERINQLYETNNATRYPLKKEKLKLNINLVKIIVLHIAGAHLDAQKIKEEDSVYGERDYKSIHGLVTSLVMKWDYKENESILKFVAELFYKIAITHYFWNGNKRTALLTLFHFLQTMGYYFSWSKMGREIISSKNYEWLVTEVVNQHKKKIHEKDTLKFIITIIKNNLLLYLKEVDY